MRGLSFLGLEVRNSLKNMNFRVFCALTQAF